MDYSLVLTHGAGSNRDAPLLQALDSAFQRVGWEVFRINLAFREKRPSGPPFPAEAQRDRDGLHEAVTRARQSGASNIYLGGHSYGGRQCSILASESPDLVSGLLLLSYPLHPPGHPDRLRTAHFPNLHTQSLFVHGSRDPFGSDDELRSALKLIPARTSLVTIEGAGHDLASRSASRLNQVAEEIVASFLEFLR